MVGLSSQIPLRLYNTATRQAEIFTLEAGQDKVRMYCCGPTVYHFAHIGNLRTYVFEDVLRRSLEYFGFAVHHVVNITDVGHLTSDQDEGEDKMEKGARRTGKTVWEVAQFYTDAFMKDWQRLNIVQPTIWCKATDHIAEQIALVQKLEQRGYTYKTDDGIYFDSARFGRYADFARLDIAGLQQGARIEAGSKRAVTDFALWKFSPPDSRRAMEWDSPWGRGFPGWHIECSAMAMHHLGPTLDIHCGGSDHVRIHHTNEIAQSECATDQIFSRFWLHGEFLRMGNSGGKMSKSTDEFLTLEVLLKEGYDPMDYRLLALTGHYRNYLNFSWEALDSARESLQSLHRKTDPLCEIPGTIESPLALSWQQKFQTAIGEDLNLPKALGVLNLSLRDIDLAESERAALVRDFDKVLGLRLDKPRLSPAGAVVETAESEWVKTLIAKRNSAKQAKDWGTCDKIRDELAVKGIVLKDTPQGTVWEKKLG